MSTFAFAAAGTGTITIQNASKGETYKAFKIFNAKVDPVTQGITYQELTSGQIENEHLKAVFEKDKAGYIVKKTAVTDAAVIAAIKAYVGDDTVNLAVAKSVKATGNTGAAGMVSAISIGTVICIVAAMAGDTSQDLKTGYIVGATPRLQQIGELIGAIVAAFAIGGVMYLLNAAWGFGSDQIPAPQATLMKMVVEGVMGGTLPWVLIFMGVFIAIVVEILGIPVLAFSIGLYLPIYLSAPIMVGGLIRWFIDNKRKYDSDAARKDGSDRGVLYAAGMIAGEGIVGILLAVLAVFGVADKINLSSVYGAAFQSVGNWVGLAAFVVLLAILFYFTRNKKTIEVDAK